MSRTKSVMDGHFDRRKDTNSMQMIKNSFEYGISTEKMVKYVCHGRAGMYVRTACT